MLPQTGEIPARIALLPGRCLALRGLPLVITPAGPDVRGERLAIHDADVGVGDEGLAATRNVVLAREAACALLIRTL